MVLRFRWASRRARREAQRTSRGEDMARLLIVLFAFCRSRGRYLLTTRTTISSDSSQILRRERSKVNRQLS